MAFGLHIWSVILFVAFIVVLPVHVEARHVGVVIKDSDGVVLNPTTTTLSTTTTLVESYVSTSSSGSSSSSLSYVYESDSENSYSGESCDFFCEIIRYLKSLVGM